jgi:hypothetical protein
MDVAAIGSESSHEHAQTVCTYSLVLSFAKPSWVGRKSSLLGLLLPVLPGLLATLGDMDIIRLLCWAARGEPPVDAGLAPMPARSIALHAGKLSKKGFL